jgi:endonuclease G
LIIKNLHIVSLLILIYAFSTCVRSREVSAHQKAIQIEDSIKQDIANVYAAKYNIVSKKDYDLLMPVMPGHITSQILERISYISSYNNKTLNPNWVAWHLKSEHTNGPYNRNGVPYYADDGTVYGIGKVSEETLKNSYFVDLESKEPRQRLSDWTREYNMSHGHMCPAADNKWDKAAMNQSFLLTNMCPQDEKLNGAGWARLEDKCRSWAQKYGDIYIVTGPIFNEPISRTIGKSRMAVPDAFFKVILCLQGAPKAIGFVYRNDSSSQSYRDNVCSVDKVEDITGFDFFSSLPDNIQDDIEKKADLKKWD